MTGFWLGFMLGAVLAAGVAAVVGWVLLGTLMDAAAILDRLVTEAKTGHWPAGAMSNNNDDPPDETPFDSEMVNKKADQAVTK